MKQKICPWAERSSLEKDYHDLEWGRVQKDELYLFEMLILEGKQAGLSWSTIIKKRESLRQAFDNFDPNIIARYDEAKVMALMANPGVIRHELKIRAVIHNAKLYLKLKEEGWSLSSFLWNYQNHQVQVNTFSESSQIPSQTSLSQTISKDLKKLGFKFVGPVSIYALMQAIGMVNDHLISCPFYKDK